MLDKCVKPRWITWKKNKAIHHGVDYLQICKLMSKVLE